MIVFTEAVLTVGIFLADSITFSLEPSITISALSHLMLPRTFTISFVFTSDSVSSSRTMILPSATFVESADCSASLFTFLFSLKE